MTTREPAPRWVKATLIVTGVVLAALVLMLLISGGHGPGRHLSAPQGQGGAGASLVFDLSR